MKPTTLSTRVILLGLIINFLPLPLLAQEPLTDIEFEYFGLEEGLSQTSVKYLLQDQHGFIWLGTQDGLNRFDGYEFVIFRNDPNNSFSIADNNIRLLYEDRSGRLWVGGESGSLQYLDRQTGRFICFPDDPELAQKIQHKRVKRVLEDHSGMLWMVGDSLFAGVEPESGVIIDHSSISKSWVSNFIFEDSSQSIWVFNNDGLQRLDPQRKNWSSFPELQADKDNWRKAFILEDRHGQLWVSAGINKLYHMPVGADHFNHFSFYPGEPHDLWKDNFLAMQEDERGNLWGATGKNGICRLNRATQEFTCYQNQSDDPNSLTRNTVWSLLKDKTGNFWVGSWAGGLDRIQDTKKRFTHIRPDPENKNSLSQEQVECFYEDPEKGLWIGTTAGGLNRLDQQTGSWTHFRQDNRNPAGIYSDQIPSLLIDSKGTLWLTAYEDGLKKMDRTTGKFIHFRHDLSDSKSLSHNLCLAILEDSKERIWVGAFDGTLNQFDPINNNFSRRRMLPEHLFGDISIILESQNGGLWIGSRQDGLVYYHPDSEELQHFQHDPSDPKSLSTNAIFSLYRDRKDRLWVGTYGAGLNLMIDEKSGTFKKYRLKDGLPNEVIYTILEDNHGRLWMSTNRGISCFDPETEVFKNFTPSDGLQSYEFNQRAAYKSPYSGKMYFGGVNGYNVFHPDSIHWDTAHAPVVFTSITRYDPEGSQDEPTTDYFIADQASLTLTADERILGFHFASLGYRQKDKIQYQYQLEGFSDHWQALGTRREVTFTNLPPGQYELRVKSTNIDGFWSNDAARLAFTILPPWYQTRWAYLLFAGSLGTVFYFINRFFRTRRRLRLELAERKQTADKLEEMAAFKNTFFTNITHEFRTPITVILGMIRQIKGNSKEKELIERNGQQLLGLINQVLDLNKIEANKMEVNWQQGDIMHYIRFCSEAFSLVMTDKQQKLEISCTPEQLLMDFDPLKMQKIINNLLSNAIKYTPTGGWIRIQAYKQEEGEQGWLKLKFSDSGPGIPRSYHDMIFRPYAQMPNSEGGSGLGLALVKELTVLQRGAIHLDSHEGQGSSFQLSFPIHQNAPLKPDEYSALVESPSVSLTKVDNNTVPWASSHASVLIVEDNPDVQYYLKQILQADYNIFSARNGKEALDLVKSARPNLIVSDLMMPEMDGYELCKVLKNGPSTQHIPIILLTAKASRQDKLKGFEYQADAYLIKPFDVEELRLRIRQLLLKHKNLKASNGNIFAKNEGLNNTENGAVAFLEKFHKILNENLQNEDFKIKALCTAMGMNHVSINKKIKEYTQHTTAQYIRYYRLNLAKEMLQHTTMTVAEIAYQVGVGEPSNFNNMFKKAFGKTPRQWRDELVFTDS